MQFDCSQIYRAHIQPFRPFGTGAPLLNPLPHLLEEAFAPHPKYCLCTICLGLYCYRSDRKWRRGSLPAQLCLTSLLLYWSASLLMMQTVLPGDKSVGTKIHYSGVRFSSTFWGFWFCHIIYISCLCILPIEQKLKSASLQIVRWKRWQMYHWHDLKSVCVFPHPAFTELPLHLFISLFLCLLWSVKICDALNISSLS